MRATGVVLRHSVRADLLAAAEHAGELTAAVATQTAETLLELCDGADAVLLTCSTLGPAAEAAAGATTVPIMRVDAALAREAVVGGVKVTVLCTVATTVEPTRHLFEEAARVTGSEIIMQFVPGAWARFKTGDRNGYLAMIAKAADEASRNGSTRVVLAQASMAGAATLASVGRRPLSSPAVGLAAAIDAIVACGGSSTGFDTTTRADATKGVYISTPNG